MVVPKNNGGLCLFPYYSAVALEREVCVDLMRQDVPDNKLSATLMCSDLKQPYTVPLPWINFWTV